MWQPTIYFSNSESYYILTGVNQLNVKEDKPQGEMISYGLGKNHDTVAGGSAPC